MVACSFLPAGTQMIYDMGLRMQHKSISLFQLPAYV